ncbi:glycoside hydrolase [Yamadazyma tenuis ATCC 10573]|uniref:glucan endo-1,3-beta-D-glucosidase n=1 Tax=Candida tenuis (strain ATCC 10573 / BCRC 21748 / CBS 615 / JCM 9827 / NBRC 10315 / NRRL Y-1498 / VKM Y-70) TaxID=590646 RepID=G3BBW4_CANTC|nr:glycoside hydrolase [Yamadazyma tenuis ATCC 10573]EGV60096.1 glycoside hydrolase [Yamadazyma tenuis ATCC 10573]
MTLSMGVWIGEDDKINTQQLEIMKKVLTKYPRKMFDSVFVGNEVLFRQDKTTNELIEIIQDVKHFVKKIGYFDLPVGTSEIGSLIDGRLLQACDIVGANIHPFFGGIDVSMATDWTYDFLKYQIEPINKSHKTKLVITEVGWPYRGGRYEGSVANATNFQYFMNAWLCESQKYDIDYYFFEAFDEPWKKIFYEDGNTWETEWGIFTSDRQMKPGVQFPKCSKNHNL